VHVSFQRMLTFPEILTKDEVEEINAMVEPIKKYITEKGRLLQRSSINKFQCEVSDVLKITTWTRGDVTSHACLLCGVHTTVQ